MDAYTRSALKEISEALAILGGLDDPENVGTAAEVANLADAVKRHLQNAKELIDHENTYSDVG